MNISQLALGANPGSILLFFNLILLVALLIAEVCV